nr:uncharacterized protein LOC127310500 [Lolium perenne]
MDTTSSAPEAHTGRGQEASSSRQGPGVNPTAYTCGAWKGSDVKQSEIDWLYRSRRIPIEVAYRIPGEELEPMPLEGEIVVCERFPRIAAEVREPCRKNRLDTVDTDPYVSRSSKMGRTHTSRPDPASTDANPQVVERAVPLQAEVGKEFLDNLASRGRKNKAPTPEAGSSEAPPAKRSKKDGGGKPFSRKRYRSQMLIASAPALSLTRSAPGMRPEAHEDATRTSTPPQPSPVPSGTGKSSASPLGGNKNAGRAAPETSHHRAEEDFFSPPDTEDTGASNIGAGNEEAERAEPPVPPTPKKKKKKATASPAKTVPETSAPASSSPAKEAPEVPAPTKDAPVPSPAAATGKPAAAEPAHPGGAPLTAQQLAAVVTAATAPPSGSQTIVLHTGRAAVAASEKASAQLGRITELSRGEVNLGQLQAYAEKWNLADLSPATRGLSKDKLPVADPSGPRSSAQHLSRLKRVVKEFDLAWHDIIGNVVGTLDSRKQLFEELLWEHRFLSEAHNKCQAALPEASSEDLSAQLSALKAEKEQLALEHRKALDAQEKISVELKDKLVQAELRHARELKEAQAAAETKLDESLKDFTDASAQLRKELEEESRLLKEAPDRNAVLTSDQAEYDRLVIQADTLALNPFPESQPHAYKKVAERRAEQALSNPDAPWDAYDHLVALAARTSHMRAVDRHLVYLSDVAMQIFKVLWPGKAPPANLTLLSNRPKDAGKRADAALRVACSWYEELDLDALHSLCGGAPTDTDPAKTAKHKDRAYRIAQSAPTSTFIPPPADLADELSDDDEEEDAGEDEEEAPEDDVVPDQALEAPAA